MTARENPHGVSTFARPHVEGVAQVTMNFR